MAFIVLASSNRGKLKEFKSILKLPDTDLIAQSEFGIDDAEETGCTFVENALIKARHATSATGLPSIADDSGLEVDALHGEPGVFSARFAGVEGRGSDAANNSKLLASMEKVPETKRTARYSLEVISNT